MEIHKAPAFVPVHLKFVDAEPDFSQHLLLKIATCPGEAGHRPACRDSGPGESA